MGYSASETPRVWTQEDWFRWYDVHRNTDLPAEFLVRNARKSDYESILDIASTTMYPIDLKSESRVYVAIRDMDVVGFTGVREFRQAPNLISIIATHAACRNLGVGEAMLRHIITDGNSYEADILEDNGPSLALFTKMGFREFGRTHGWIRVLYER